ncbi:hypothetical protein [Nocardia sp. CDC160]|uniref:hypothetical protein n=1 Tax=Nocardia sp. CDC160 TaxID=3112166 RepID=UPI002DB8589A|nr:hypothetical protein [Nocardia sp. CDC160]MEC3917240.1 hypothetical protein [Nocardia sp. CDC160]
MVVVTGVSVVVTGVSVVVTGVSVAVVPPEPSSVAWFAPSPAVSSGTGTSLGVSDTSATSLTCVVESNCVVVSSVVDEDALTLPTLSSPRDSTATTAATVSVSSAVTAMARGRCLPRFRRGFSMNGVSVEALRPSSFVSDGSTR